MKCSYCNKDFKPKRSTAKYCSSKCRVYDKRTKPVAVVYSESSIIEPKIFEKLKPAMGMCKNEHALDWRGKCFGKGCKYA